MTGWEALMLLVNTGIMILLVVKLMKIEKAIFGSKSKSQGAQGGSHPISIAQG
jgi:hypothetical protein